MSLFSRLMCRLVYGGHEMLRSRDEKGLPIWICMRCLRTERSLWR